MPHRAQVVEVVRVPIHQRHAAEVLWYMQVVWLPQRSAVVAVCEEDRSTKSPTLLAHHAPTTGRPPCDVNVANSCGKLF